MAAFVAFGETLEENIIGTIFSFLDDSSLVINCSTAASDIGKLEDLEGFDHPRDLLPSLNRYRSRWVMRDSLEYIHRYR